MIDRSHKQFSEEDIETISDTYHSWRSAKKNYKNKLTYCKSVKLQKIRDSRYSLSPPRYVGAEDFDFNEENFNDKLKELNSELIDNLSKSKEFEKRIKQNMSEL